MVRVDRYRPVFSWEKALMLLADSFRKARDLYCSRARWIKAARLD